MAFSNKGRPSLELGLGGALGLDGLSDVAITTPAVGHVLRHDGAQFVNVALTAAHVGAGTFTGSFVFGSQLSLAGATSSVAYIATGSGGFNVNTTLGSTGVQWQDAGVNRVIMRLDSATQWTIQSRDVAGAGIDAPLLFNMALNGDLRLGGAGRPVIINQSAGAFSTVAGLYVRGNYNPSAGTARIVRLDGTLTATANSDVLIALDLAAAYVPGAFSSVTGYGLRIAGLTAATLANYGVYVNSVSGGTSNYAIFTNTGLVRFGDAVTTTSTFTATGQITSSAGVRAGIGFAVQTTPVDNALFYAPSSATVGSASTSSYNIYVAGTHAAAATANIYGMFAQLRSAVATFTTTNGFGVYVANPSLGAGHTLTTNYGIYVGGQTAGGTNYAIYTNEGLVRFGGVVTATVGLTISSGSFVSGAFSDVGGYSASYGTTTNITTTGLRVRMGTSASATWLVAGTSADVFRGGFQLLDAGGAMRVYLGSNYAHLASGSGTTVSLSNVGTLDMAGSAVIGDGTRAAAGTIRLANTRTIAWRNSTNSGDVTLTVNSANRFEMSTPLTVGSGGTGLDSTAYSGITGQRFVVYDDSGTFTVVSAGTSGQALLSGGAGGDLLWGNPTPAAHSITSHTASGLTTGHVLTATGATTYAFQALSLAASAVTAGTFPGATYTFSDQVTANTMVATNNIVAPLIGTTTAVNTVLRANGATRLTLLSAGGATFASGAVTFAGALSGVTTFAASGTLTLTGASITLTNTIAQVITSPTDAAYTGSTYQSLVTRAASTAFDHFYATANSVVVARIRGNGAAVFADSVTGTVFIGSGASLTSLQADAISAGTIAAGARLGTGGATGRFLQYAAGTPTWAVPPTFNSTDPGYAPASGGGTANFLRADGSWASPTVSSISASSITNGTFAGTTYAWTNGFSTPSITMAGAMDIHTTGANALTLGTNGTTRITIGSAGGVGFNIAASATAGRIDASNDIVSFSSSDLRLKRDVRTVHDPLEQLALLRAIDFEWNPDLYVHHGYRGRDFGVVAQEVQAVFPHMPNVVHQRSNGYLGVRYERLIPLLLAGINRLQERVRQLENA